MHGASAQAATRAGTSSCGLPLPWKTKFTLFGDVRKGKRPSFITAAKPESAKFHYEKFINLIEKTDIRIEKGIFQADMLVKIYNDGPVTILIDSKKKF